MLRIGDGDADATDGEERLTTHIPPFPSGSGRPSTDASAARVAIGAASGQFQITPTSITIRNPAIRPARTIRCNPQSAYIYTYIYKESEAQ